MHPGQIPWERPDCHKSRACPVLFYGPSGFNMGKGGFTQYSEVPLLCQEGTGEVETWKRNTEASPFNLSPFVPLYYPTFILHLQREGILPRTLRSGPEEPDTHGKPGSAL